MSKFYHFTTFHNAKTDKGKATVYKKINCVNIERVELVEYDSSLCRLSMMFSSRGLIEFNQVSEVQAEEIINQVYTQNMTLQELKEKYNVKDDCLC